MRSSQSNNNDYQPDVLHVCNRETGLLALRILKAQGKGKPGDKKRIEDAQRGVGSPLKLVKHQMKVSLGGVASTDND